ncbi:MAG: hypothetical protein GX601_15730, partial [Anaerolineales bacterium]|nr:hypothetical protein [Anaerolineales bacterium]
VDVHLEMSGALTLREAHALASSLEKRAKEEIQGLREVTTHIEPYGQLSQAVDLDQSQLAQRVRSAASEIVPAEAIHSVHVWQDGTAWSASVHYSLPGNMPLTKAHALSRQLEDRLRERIAGLQRVVIHTEPQEE